MSLSTWSCPLMKHPSHDFIYLIFLVLNLSISPSPSSSLELFWSYCPHFKIAPALFLLLLFFSGSNNINGESSGPLLLLQTQTHASGSEPLGRSLGELWGERTPICRHQLSSNVDVYDIMSMFIIFVWLPSRSWWYPEASRGLCLNTKRELQ